MGQKVEVGGTVYDLKAGKCLIGGTAYAAKKGRTLIGGTGYDVKLKNSLIWYLTDNLGYDVLEGTLIGFTANGKHFAHIQAYRGALFFSIVDGNGRPYNQTLVYNEGWVNVAYRTITFDEEPTGDLLTWLEAHGTNV